MLACFLGVTSVAVAHGPRALGDLDPTTRPRSAAAQRRSRASDPTAFRPSWDLDGIYLWLGPTGAASRVEASLGLDVRRRTPPCVRVRERAPLGVVGGDARREPVDRARRRAGLARRRRRHPARRRMIGASAGPILELARARAPPARRLGRALGVRRASPRSRASGSSRSWAGLRRSGCTSPCRSSGADC